MLGKPGRTGAIRVAVAATPMQLRALMLAAAAMVFSGAMLVAYVAVELGARLLGHPYLALDAHASASTWVDAFGMILLASAALLVLCTRIRTSS